MTLYWATDRESPEWHGPVESAAEAAEAAKYRVDLSLDTAEIWVAPVDAELDDEDAFWDALADHLLVWGVENAVETLIEDGWLDSDEGWAPVQRDRDRILANALRQVLGPRPEWRCVDTSKARRVEL